ncbi:MAG: copper resistance system multicopper oxidase [Gammaproteobacteria bacterium]|nr:copper resistance system multicopper oxidase [Gammaproteobacteria bacterium]
MSRRTFVKGVAMGGAAGLLGLDARPLLASMDKGQNGPVTLTGTQFDLTYSPTLVNFTGEERYATAINGSVPAPILRWKEGDRVTMRVKNNLAEDTSIHWHGIILPSEMDGVPHISNGFGGIKPGETFTYSFDIHQNGTYWYHSHSGFQEPTGAYGAIIIEPKEPAPYKFDREYVIVISDWSDEDPYRVYHKLKKNSDYYNFKQRTYADLSKDIKENGLANTWNARKMWMRMRMSDRDISDVTGYTYTFLMNGQNPADGWTGLFKRGEKVLLRFINAAAMTFFDVRIPGLKMTVVAADGQYIEPVTIDEMRIGVAETFDVLVEPSDDRAYTIFSQAIDRSGYARGTLTPDLSLKAAVPEMDPDLILTHTDMGMDMGGMSMPGMNGAGHDMSNMKKADSSKEMSGDMPEMDHIKPKMSGDMPGMDHSKMSGMTGGGANSRMNPSSAKAGMGNGLAGYGSSREVRHFKSEYGPQVDMRADGQKFRIDDPGVGLRNNGRRVLTYADLANLYPTPDPREPGREIDLHLTGNMSRYMWSVNGIKFADADPIQLKFGERVRMNLVNDTMMNHPIHLHGMWSDIETGDPKRIPRKHTVVVQPGQKISFLVTADAMGGWAYHCHLFYHLLGMFRKVEVV